MNVHASYIKLAKEFLVRPIRSVDEFQKALEIVKHLAVKADDLDAEQMDYLEALSRFVADWESQHHGADLSLMAPLELLRFLMNEQQMSVASLGRILGNASAASMVHSGKRELSKAQILVLSAYFGIEAGAFLGANPGRSVSRKVVEEAEQNWSDWSDYVQSAIASKCNPEPCGSSVQPQFEYRMAA